MKYNIYYYTVEKRVYLIMPVLAENVLFPQDVAALLNDIDLYTAKQQLEAKGIDCTMIDDQIKMDEEEAIDMNQQ